MPPPALKNEAKELDAAARFAELVLSLSHPLQLWSDATITALNTEVLNNVDEGVPMFGSTLVKGMPRTASADTNSVPWSNDSTGKREPALTNVSIPLICASAWVLWWR